MCVYVRTCIYVHITCTCTYSVNVRVCVCVVCWCRGRVSSVSSLVLLSHFWPLFLPLAQCPHPGSGLPQSRFRGLMQKEASRSRGANPPLPLPVNTEKKHKTRTGPFSDLQFQPGVVHRSVPQHLTHLHILQVEAQICYYYVRTKPRATNVSRDFRAYPTVRPRYGCGTVRYGTARVESSPAQCRLGQHSIFHLSALTLFPCRFVIAKPSLAAPVSAAPSLIQLRLPCLCCGLADVDHRQNIADGQFARSPDYCLVLRPHQTNPLPSTSSSFSVLLLCIPYVQCCMSDRWRRRLDIIHAHSWSILSEPLYPDQSLVQAPPGAFFVLSCLFDFNLPEPLAIPSAQPPRLFGRHYEEWHRPSQVV